MTAQAPTYLIELDEEVTRCAKELNIDPDKTQKLAKLIGKSLSHRWGGLSIYFLKTLSKREALQKKYAEIIEEYNGENVRELARKYDLCEGWIYSIVKAK